MTTPTDVDDGELLWRRIHPTHTKEDGKVFSVAFRDIEMSVDIASIQQDMSVTLKDGAGVAEIRCSEARELGQEVLKDPVPGNPAHALVRGRKTKQIQRALRDRARFVARDDIISNS